MHGFGWNYRERCVAIAMIVAVCAIALGAVGNVATAESGGPTSITAAAPSAGLEQAVRLGAPAIIVRSSPPTLANVSRCRTDLPSAIARVTIPSISYDCPVYPGDQSTMDSGAATWVTNHEDNATLATQVGGPGAIWLAGHRTAHGGAFAAIPDLADGAVVTLTEGTSTASYRIVGRVRVEIRDGLVIDATGTPTNAATVNALIRTDHGGAGLPPRLVIQTCDGDRYRWMLYGDLITA